MELLGSFGDVGLSLAGTILAFLFVLTLIVFIHEMGHFLAARWCGVGVQHLLRRLRPGTCRLHRPQGHALEALRHPARRLRQVSRRRERGERHRPRRARRHDSGGAEPHLRRKRASARAPSSSRPGRPPISSSPSSSSPSCCSISGRSVVAPAHRFRRAGRSRRSGRLRAGRCGDSPSMAAQSRAMPTSSGWSGSAPAARCRSPSTANGETLELTATPDSEPAPGRISAGSVGSLGIRGPAMPPRSDARFSPARRRRSPVLRSATSSARSTASRSSTSTISATSSGRGPGEALAVVLDRNGEELRVEVTPEERQRA